MSEDPYGTARHRDYNNVTEASPCLAPTPGPCFLSGGALVPDTLNASPRGAGIAYAQGEGGGRGGRAPGGGGYVLPPDAIRVSGDYPETAGQNQTFYRMDAATGNLRSYEVYDASGLPIKRVDLMGRTHGGVATPHVQEFDRHTAPNGTVFVSPGDVRAAKPEEIP